jgi:hypothetical protein
VNGALTVVAFILADSPWAKVETRWLAGVAEPIEMQLTLKTLELGCGGVREKASANRELGVAHPRRL